MSHWQRWQRFAGRTARGLLLAILNGTDYGILNISAQLAVFMALAGLGEWLLVGSVIGLVYKRPGV